jgi:hypothetical protein
MAKKAIESPVYVRQIGDFVLRNNRCSAHCCRGQEKGIVVSDKYYLHLDSLLTVPISKSEARDYGKRMKFPLPTKKQMQLLADNLERINMSLIQIGRGDCLLFKDTLETFWTSRESVKRPPDERRGVVFILPI